MSFNIVNIIILVTIEDGIKKKCSISVFSRFYCYRKHKLIHKNPCADNFVTSIQRPAT